MLIMNSMVQNKFKMITKEGCRKTPFFFKQTEVIQMEKQRIYLFDNLKFFLIITVVIGHFADSIIEYPSFKSLFLFIYSFHMPLFIYISGVFHKNKKTLEKVLIYTLLGYLLKIAIFFTKIISGTETKFQFFTEQGIPWFMFALAAFTLMSYLLRNINKRFVLLFALFLGCIVNYDASIGDFLYLSRIIVFFPFYHLGTMTKVETLRKMNYKKSNKLAGVIIIIIWTLACTVFLDFTYNLRPLLTARNPFPETLYPFGGLVRLFCYVLIFALNFAFISITPDKKIPFWTKFGPRTMQVYFWHRPILYTIEKLEIPSILCISTVGKLIFIGSSVLLSFILSAKIFGFPTAPILGLRDKLRVIEKD